MPHCNYHEFVQLRLNLDIPQQPIEWVKRTPKNSAINKQIVINRQLCLDAITGNKLEYAEAHHIKAISAGGSDTLDNIVVVEPRIHRVIHLLQDRQDIALRYENYREYRLIPVTAEEIAKVDAWLRVQGLVFLENFLIENTRRYLKSGGWLVE